MRSRSPSNLNRWEFNARGFALAVFAARTARGWSTRELARRAGISQAYVVTLERPRLDAPGRAPSPTLDLVARLADALELPLVELIAAGLRREGRHVLLVVDDQRRSPLAHAARAVGDEPMRWIWASTSCAAVPPQAHHHIDLRRDTSAAYQPELISAALRDELALLRDDIDGAPVGFVFAETSAVMSTLDDPATIIAFEHAWADVVNRAASDTGAHAAWNICVYEIAALQQLSEPSGAVLDLIRSHDTVWSARRDHLLTGSEGARRVLDQLRPDGTPRNVWRDTVDAMVASLDLAA